MEYSPADRQIFGPYSNGLQQVFGDPLAIDRRMRAHLNAEPREIAALANDPQQPEQVRYDAMERMLRAAEFAFQMHPFDPASGGGILEEEIKATIKAFNDWMEQKKKTPPSSPTCSPATESPSAPASSPTSSTSAST